MEQLDSCSFKNKFIESQAELDKESTFYVTLMAIMSCDVVVTCDSAVAHLAGFSGVKTFLLLNKEHDLRWGNKPTYFLYPNMIIKRLNDNTWEEVLIEVAEYIEHVNNN